MGGASVITYELQKFTKLRNKKLSFKGKFFIYLFSLLTGLLAYKPACRQAGLSAILITQELFQPSHPRLLFLYPILQLLRYPEQYLLCLYFYHLEYTIQLQLI